MKFEIADKDEDTISVAELSDSHPYVVVKTGDSEVHLDYDQVSDLMHALSFTQSRLAAAINVAPPVRVAGSPRLVHA